MPMSRDVLDKFLEFLNQNPEQENKLTDVIELLEAIAVERLDVYRQTAIMLRQIQCAEKPFVITPDRQFVIDALRKMQSKHAIADAYIDADNLDGLRIYWAREVGRYEADLATLIKLLETRDDDRRKSP